MTDPATGAGKGPPPCRRNETRPPHFWIIELPLAWFLAYRVGLGPDGVFAAVTIAFSAIAVLAAWLFRKGRWKRIEV